MKWGALNFKPFSCLLGSWSSFLRLQQRVKGYVGSTLSWGMQMVHNKSILLMYFHFSDGGGLYPESWLAKTQRSLFKVRQRNWWWGKVSHIWGLCGSILGVATRERLQQRDSRSVWWNPWPGQRWNRAHLLQRVCLLWSTSLQTWRALQGCFSTLWQAMESNISASFFGKNNLTGTEEVLWDFQSSLPLCREPVCTSKLKISIIMKWMPPENCRLTWREASFNFTLERNRSAV